MGSCRINVGGTERLSHLKSRQSHRPLIEPVPRADELHLAFEAAIRAQDHIVRQPCGLVVVSSNALPALSERFAEPAINRAAEDGSKRSRNQAWEAPMVGIVVAQICCDCQVRDIPTNRFSSRSAMSSPNTRTLWKRRGYGPCWLDAAVCQP